jgi:hypothetical protein
MGRSGAAAHGRSARRRSLLVALTAGAAVAGLALVPTSAGQLANAPSGRWARSAPADGTWLLSQRGQSG